MHWVNENRQSGAITRRRQQGFSKVLNLAEKVCLSTFSVFGMERATIQSPWRSKVNLAKPSPTVRAVQKPTMIYKGDSSYHMEQHMTGTSESVTIIDESYLGSCPADMKPGDVVMANGTKMNLGAP